MFNYLASSLNHELIYIAAAVFLTGFVAFIESTNFLSVLVSVEIMMLGSNFYLIASSITAGDVLGQVYALCILSATAAETAIGLGILILLYRTRSNIGFNQAGVLGW
jgi:NADH-quinone oxidoreductase subunit K